MAVEELGVFKLDSSLIKKQMIEPEDNQLEISLEEDNTAEKAEKFEKERQEILNNAVSGRIENIRDKVAYLLNNFTAARNSDIELTWLFWETFEKEVFKGIAVTKQDLFRLTKLNSISRVRAKIQNEYKLFQADDKIKKYRGVLEEEKKQEAIEDKPNYPLYTIFIDETGKTQQYLSVGSLWLTDPRSDVSARFELLTWMKSQNIGFEFHFTELSNQKLDHYKVFFLKFLVLHPSAGFKAIYS